MHIVGYIIRSKFVIFTLAGTRDCHLVHIKWRVTYKTSESEKLQICYFEKHFDELWIDTKYSDRLTCTVNRRLNCVLCAVELVRSFCPCKGVVCTINLGRPISEYQVTFNRLITPQDTRGEVLVSAYKYGSLAFSRLLGQPNISILFFSIPASLHPHSDRPTRQINSKIYRPVITECSRFQVKAIRIDLTAP